VTIGFCIGVFDCFHVGHLRLIERASEQCGHLIVAVVQDAAVRAQKGENRPIIPFEQRIAIVEGLKATGKAIPSMGFDPYQAVKDSMNIYGKIDYYFKGADQQHVPTDKIEKLGIKIIMLDRTPDVSTTKIVSKLK
jgi:glycerol-3-phosphate cytidylyltransferase